jgi:phage-related protein
MTFPTHPNITPSFSPSNQEQSKARVIDFSGYQLRLSIGPNPITRTIQVAFNGRVQADRDALISFYRAQQGVTPFYWLMPGDAVPLKWVCMKWGDQRTQDSLPGAPLYDVTAEFNQVFDPGP